MKPEPKYSVPRKEMEQPGRRKVVLYIAMSLDGYIAKPDDDIGFLNIVEKQGEDYGYSDFIKSLDTVIMGRKTYEKILDMGLGFPHSDKETYVMTHTGKSPVGSVTFYTGNLKDLVTGLKVKAGKNIFVDGGAQIINELLMESLIDELTVSIIPVLLGDGIPLFKGGRPESGLALTEVKHYDTGLVQLKYHTSRNQVILLTHK